MKKRPLISFCIATYKRPEFLKQTIEIILRQKYENIEIVISEDPSDNNSESIVKSFKSKKIIYQKNKKHLGQLKSYNKAISLSKGDFIVLLADDDPPTFDMMETFKKAFARYPSAKAFWGASYANITTDKMVKVTHLKKGFNSLINKNKKRGTIETLEPKDFFRKFFKQEIFPHYQWTAAIIAKSVIEKMKGVPDYDSAHFIDYAYLLKIAERNKFIIINKEMGSFALHEGSYGKRKDTLKEYINGVIGFDNTISKLADNYGYVNEYQKFITDYVIMFLIGRLEFYKIHNLKVDSNDLFKVYKKISKSLPFFTNREKEVYFKLQFYTLYQFSNKIRKIYGKIKSKILDK